MKITRTKITASKQIKASSDWVRKFNSPKDGGGSYYRFDSDSGYAIVEWNDNDGDGYYMCYINIPGQEQKRAAKYPLDDAKAWAEVQLANANVDSCTAVKGSTSTRDRISYLEDKIEILEEYLRRNEYEDPEERIDDQLELQELKEQLNFAWQDDEADYNYALQQQEFNPDGSLKGYDDIYECTQVTASTTTISKAKSDCQWMVGLYWDIDGHIHEITGVNGYPLFSCEVTEDWISEDTFEQIQQKSYYAIKEDENGNVYIQNKKYPKFKLYLNSAFNYMELVPDEFNEFDFSDKDDSSTETLRQLIDRYIKEAGAGDYYNSVKVIDEDSVLYEGNSLEEAKSKLTKYLDCNVIAEWHDDKITIQVLVDYYEDNYTPSSTFGDYGPSNPWDAPGMSTADFI